MVTAGIVNIETGAHALSFTDPTPVLADRIFYRIKVILKNGSFAHSKIVSVNDQQQKKFNLIASPSPFQETLHLFLHSNKDQQIVLNLYDLSGRIVHSKKLICTRGDNQYSGQNLSALSKAIYYITAQSADDLLVKKVVRE